MHFSMKPAQFSKWAQRTFWALAGHANDTDRVPRPSLFAGDSEQVELFILWQVALLLAVPAQERVS